MSDQNITNPPPPPIRAPQQENTGDSNMVNIIYILYLVGIPVPIVVPTVGVVMAYMNKDDAPQWLESHYRFQIRTFWIGLLFGLIGYVLTFIFIGFLVLLFALVWWVIRCVKGMRALGNRQPVENVEGWMF